MHARGLTYWVLPAMRDRLRGLMQPPPPGWRQVAPCMNPTLACLVQIPGLSLAGCETHG